MLNLIVIALALTSGNPDKSAPSLNTVHQNTDGSYTVVYRNHGSIKARNHNAAHFAADEGNNGIAPLSIAKHL